MKYLLIILGIKAVILGILISLGYIGLAPDEAQYWTWSQDLDWGYYSKPPGIAWQIRLTTLLFGNTLFGIRCGALLIAFLLSLALYNGAIWAGLNKQTAYWTAVIFAVSPLGVYLSIVATTDGGAILFLLLAIIILIKGATDCKGPNYWLAGIAICLGGVFKWTAFIFWPITLIYLLAFKNFRKWNLIGGVLISLLALLPTIYWNTSHEWATFRHVSSTVKGAHGGNFFDFLGAQMALVSPIFFIFLIITFFLVWVGRRSLMIAAGFPLVIFIYLAAALFKKMQPNWAAYLYPSGFILIAWMGCEWMRKGKVWLHIGTYLSLMMVMAAFMIPWLQSSGISISYKINPFRQSVGWNSLQGALEQAGYNGEKHFLFGDKYQTASLLSFYGPHQKRAYFFNLGGSRKNQFSFWPQMDPAEVGKSGFFVVLENTDASSLNWYANHYQEKLSPYFRTLHFRGAYPLFCVAHKPVKYALIFEGSNYLGGSPPDVSSY